MIDISAVMTCHSEGLLMGPSISSLKEAIVEAMEVGLSVEIIIILDNASALTKSIFEDLERHKFRVPCTVYHTKLGDPGMARNYGVKKGKGEYVAFLDADDLWSYNWLVNAHQKALSMKDDVILHSSMNIIFGNSQNIWVHTDSTDRSFDVDYFLISNYWDRLAFAKRDIYKKIPFVENEIKEGFGHEDWHWNCLTLGEGIHHCAVPETIHFKRARDGSQMAVCHEADVVVRENPLDSFRKITAYKEKYGLSPM